MGASALGYDNRRCGGRGGATGHADRRKECWELRGHDTVRDHLARRHRSGPGNLLKLKQDSHHLPGCRALDVLQSGELFASGLTIRRPRAACSEVSAASGSAIVRSQRRTPSPTHSGACCMGT